MCIRIQAVGQGSPSDSQNYEDNWCSLDCFLEVEGKAPIAENTKHLGHRATRIKARCNLKTSLPQFRIHGSRRY